MLTLNPHDHHKRKKELDRNWRAHRQRTRSGELSLHQPRGRQTTTSVWDKALYRCQGFCPPAHWSSIIVQVLHEGSQHGVERFVICEQALDAPQPFGRHPVLQPAPAHLIALQRVWLDGDAKIPVMVDGPHLNSRHLNSRPLSRVAKRQVECRTQERRFRQ
eukprot:666862-Amphidinium_carterae.2